MNRFAVCSILALTVAAGAVRAADLESARRKIHESRRPGAVLEAPTTADATVAAPAQGADSSVEKFNIGVEYHGGVIKKRDDHIGEAVMKCVTTGPNTFEVSLSGHATTPDKKRETVDFTTLRKFRIDGNVVTVVGSEDQFKGAAEKYRTKILNMIALAYLIKFRSPIYGAADPTPVSYVVDSKKYEFQFARLGAAGAWREVQVSLHEVSDNNRNLGKFFLSPSNTAPSPFRKFRIQTKDKLGINFFTI